MSKSEKKRKKEKGECKNHLLSLVFGSSRILFNTFKGLLGHLSLLAGFVEIFVILMGWTKEN